MHAIVFNSVPMEDIKDTWGTDAAKDRARSLIREMLRLVHWLKIIDLLNYYYVGMWKNFIT